MSGDGASDQVDTLHTVTANDLATALGSGDAAVLGTPRLIAWLEAAAFSLAKDRVEPSETTVGVRIDFDHLAPSRVGDRVTVTVRLIEATGRRFVFVLEAVDERGTVVGRGSHVRVRVDRSAF